MKRIVLLIIVGLTSITTFCFYSHPVQGVVWIEGHITSDTTWLPVDTYRVIDDTYVDPGITLTIQPGVRVELADDFSLNVEGSLNAIGTGADPIVFTSSQISPSSGAWNTIKFEGGSGEHFLLRNVEIKYAVHGVTIKSQESATIEKSKLVDCSGSGIMLVGRTNVTITGNTITQNTNGIATNDAEHARILIVDNSILGNKGDGIYLRELGADPLCNVTISSNTISSNYGHGINVNQEWDIHNATISFNTVLSNSRDGINLHCFRIFDSTVSSNTLLLNNRNGMYLEGHLHDLVISFNTASSNHATGMHIDAVRLVNVTISSNSVCENNKGIWIEGGAYHQEGLNTNVNHNSICNNSYGVFYEKAGWLGGVNLATHNNIYYNSYGMYVTHDATVNAEDNYWGHLTGPYHLSLNPEGEGNTVNGDGTDLDFIPFLTSPVGTINERPVAVLEVDETTPHFDETVTFDATSSTDDGRIDYYFFDFGDGGNSSWTTLPVVTHKYPEEGEYHATLIVMDDFGVKSLDGDLVYVEITVIPEFPSILILPLFMIATLLAVILCKREHFF